MGTLVLNEFSDTSLFERIIETENVSHARGADTVTSLDEEVSTHQARPSPDVPAGRQTPPEIDQIKALADFSIQIGSAFAEQLLLHPCIVLRRQCQIHHTGAWYHLTPLSLIQTVINIVRKQGGAAMWKGLGSVYIVSGVNLIAGAVVSELTGFPKEMSRQIPLLQLGGHVLLKGHHQEAKPIYFRLRVKTIQKQDLWKYPSNVSMKQTQKCEKSDIASERSRMFDTLFEGALRMTAWGIPKTARQIPLWQLILPTVIFKMSHYLLTSIAQCTVLSSMRVEQEEVREQHGEEGKEHSVYETYFPELLASFTGAIIADMITFPLETVLNRLYVQGTRTIIDNTDTGIGVIPVNTHYDGVLDCFKCIIVEEGLQGLYRGFGALILQYTLHAVILKLIKFMCEHLPKEFSSQHSPYRQFPDSPSGAQYKAQAISYGEGFL